MVLVVCLLQRVLRSSVVHTAGCQPLVTHEIDTAGFEQDFFFNEIEKNKKYQKDVRIHILSQIVFSHFCVYMS